VALLLHVKYVIPILQSRLPQNFNFFISIFSST